MYEAAAKCARAGIRVTFNLIFGFPGEEEQHREETLRVVGDIARRFDNVNFSPNLFTPYPGIPIWPELESLGLREPDSLADWARVDLGANNLPWLGGASLRRLETGIRYLLLHKRLNHACRHSRSKIIRTLLDLAGAPLHWRLKHSFFSCPLELSLASVPGKVYVRRSLLTGQPLSKYLVHNPARSR